MEFEVYENKNPRVVPTRPRWMKGFNILFWIVAALAVLGTLFIGLLADLIWMDSLGFRQVFLTIFWNKLLLGFLGFLLYALAMFVTLYLIRRTYLRSFGTIEVPGMIEIPGAVRSGKWFFWINLGLSALFGLIGSLFTRGLGWERFLKFFHPTPFGVTDPMFGRDVAFYVFTLPFLEFVLGMLIGLMLVLLIVEAVAYSVFRLFLRDRGAQLHLSVTVGLLGLLLALQHLLRPFETLFTNQASSFQTSVVWGTSFTDRVVNIPMAYVMAVVSIVAALILILGLFRGNMRWLRSAFFLYFGVLIIWQVAAVVVQNFIVTPNEFAREKPYLQHNLDYTRKSYGLENIREQEHPANATLDAEMIQRNIKTIENIRINDARPLLDVYNQLQTFRTYYEFRDVDVDRYIINGKYQQVFIGARELDITHLPEQAHTWVNRTLRYTHGYGVAMSNVNTITPQGQPDYILKDLPPQGEVEVTRPQIYFGEGNYHNVIVNAVPNEFDYPQGDSNVETRFEADSGIPMTRFNRFVYAWEEMSPRIFISGLINEESQLLRNRNIMDRVRAIAPFLTYDPDAYIVLRDDGTLVWIIDAYTLTSQYPYSEPVRGQTNYIRNPIKVMVDAYTGEVHFFLIDPDEPIAQTYQKIFPDLFTTEIPDDIMRHIRYPETLFTYQAEIYRTYHMTDLEVFYNREDFWQFPTENYYQPDTTMVPYYATMKLPDTEEEEFILMIPFTPNNRQNMIAWMAARNDGEHYGELLVYRFPKQKTVYGPQQIENRVNQDPEISQQLNLWSQGGSRVIRGNLLVIPIEDTLLYVEPIYLESSNETALPEVQRIVLAYGNHIVMERNFETAMQRLLERIGSGAPPPGGEGEGAPGAPITLTADQLVQVLGNLYEQYLESNAAGNFAEAGRILEEIGRHLQQWQGTGSPQGPEPAAEEEVQPQEGQEESQT